MIPKSFTADRDALGVIGTILVVLLVLILLGVITVTFR
jgi:hypothetical protein